MMIMKNNLGIFCLAILLWFGALTRPAWAQSISDLKLDASRVSWTGLSFQAKNLWVEVSTDVELRSLPASDIAVLLLKSPKGAPVKPAKPYASTLTINTTIDPAFRSSVRIHNRIWFNQTDAAALGRIRLRRGEDDFKKIYRFTQQGVFRLRKEPRDEKEASFEPEKWTDVKESFYSYDLPQKRCLHISERSVLIYVVSAAPIYKNNEPLSLCVFGKRQLHHIRLRAEGLHPLRVNYIVKTSQTEIRKKGKVATLKIAVESQPMAPDLEEAENFSLLGLHQHIAVYVDPASSIPIQISGIIPAIGKVNLKLRQVRLRQRAD